ncbi:MAG: acyl-CoA dehydrogenase family protein [Chloroflexi bacterium]|nr:acyl-CoA dehydrogenase family protein [Chloroflexota bacterium]
MDYTIPASHLTLKKTVREYLAKRVAPYADKWENEEHLPMEIIKEMGQLGFFSCIYPEEYGGTDMGWLANIFVSEEIGRAWQSLAGQVSNPQSGTCPMVIMLGAKDHLKKEFLPKLCSAEMLGCFAVTEPNAATDVGGIETKAIRQDSHYIVNGTKIWATGASVCGVAVTFAKTNPKLRQPGISAFLITPDMPGVSMENIHGKLGFRAMKSGYIFFQDAKIPEEYRIGEEGQGWTVAMTALEYGRLTVAARALGLSQACQDAAIYYATTREQFGQKIGKFQAIKFLVADIIVAAETARAMLYKAAWMADEKLPFAHEANLAKFVASEAGASAARACQQIYGAYGYSSDFPIARYFRDSMLYVAGEGSNLIQKIIIADDVMGLKKAEARRLGEHVEKKA